MKSERSGAKGIHSPNIHWTLIEVQTQGYNKEEKWQKSLLSQSFTY